MYGWHRPVLVPEFSHRYQRCARWLTDKRAMIALTCVQTDDQIWFTFFRELAPLLHRRRYSFVLDNASENLADKIVDRMQRYEDRRIAID
jgi:hypothetical protein